MKKYSLKRGFLVELGTQTTKYKCTKNRFIHNIENRFFNSYSKKKYKPTRNNPTPIALLKSFCHRTIHLVFFNTLANHPMIKKGMPCPIPYTSNKRVLLTNDPVIDAKAIIAIIIGVVHGDGVRPNKVPNE
ncbi:hypothetical protein C273_10542 [Staphylococcus massiliensis S46]|uniref:Uncharacterized protein n=1 Tax=Staphylococcus massiliensis S46 TaxID=1229783 RepID=K9ATI5_9STAP|nr:hypothetical protein [Staphylococcus massiliensis]EKU45882.1 hypothetical protein C273_10542 [Staphylococcus massiliensis S46]